MNGLMKVAEINSERTFDDMKNQMAGDAAITGTRGAIIGASLGPMGALGGGVLGAGAGVLGGAMRGGAGTLIHQIGDGGDSEKSLARSAGTGAIGGAAFGAVGGGLPGAAIGGGLGAAGGALGNYLRSDDE